MTVGETAGMCQKEPRLNEPRIEKGLANESPVYDSIHSSSVVILLLLFDSDELCSGGWPAIHWGCLLSVCCVISMVLGTEDLTANETDLLNAPWSF